MENEQNSILFDNIGSKLKTVAGIFCWVGIIGYIIGGIAMFILDANALYLDETPYVTYGIIMIILGPIASWLSSLILYAFGKLVEDVEAIRDKNPSIVKVEAAPVIKQPTSKTAKTVVNTEPINSTKKLLSTSTNTDFLPKEEHKVKEEPEHPLPCPLCGENLAFMGWDDTDLQENQICPFCGKEISFNE